MRLTKHQLRRLILESYNLLSEEKNISSVIGTFEADGTIDINGERIYSISIDSEQNVTYVTDKRSPNDQDIGDGKTRKSAQGDFREQLLDELTDEMIFPSYKAQYEKERDASNQENLEKYGAEVKTYTAKQLGINLTSEAGGKIEKVSTGGELRGNIRVTSSLGDEIATGELKTQIRTAIEEFKNKKGKSAKSGKYNAKTQILQKTIDPDAKHTKADGVWGKGTQKAWEEYVSTGEFEFAAYKQFPDISEDKVLKIIDKLPKKATAVTELGYKGNIAGVLAFIEDVNKNITAGGDSVAIEKALDGTGDVDSQFVEDADADEFAEKIKGESPKNKERLVTKLVNVVVDHRDEKKKERADKKVRKMLKDDPGALAAYEKATKEKGLKESLSRGELYRRRYWGRY